MNVRSKPSFLSEAWHNPKVRSVFYQLVAFIFIVYISWSIFDNAMSNMQKRGMSSGFGFLSSNTGFGIIQILVDYTEESSYWRAFLVGVLNTLLVSFLGVFFATLLGFVIGISRLSSNWLISKIAGAYIEIFRNIPLLLQILFWYNAVLKPLPSPRDLYEKGDLLFFALNNRGLYLPKPVFSDSAIFVLLALIAGLILTIWIRKKAKKTQILTGNLPPTLLKSGLFLLVIPGLVWLFLQVTQTEYPISSSPALMESFQLGGGLVIIPEFFALLVALVMYTASFIAEIVRSGIQAIDKGQTEASYALGISPGNTLKLVVIPQAMQIIIPPLTSQYLNLTKNSSLAAAIAYPDLVSVFAGTVLNQTGQAIEIIGLTMAVYLFFSLSTSMIMNFYNDRKRLRER